MEIRRALYGLLPLIGGVIIAGVVIAVLLSAENSSIGAVWRAMTEFAWENPGRRARVIQVMLPLLLCSIGLLLTFTAGLWNIGIEGQLTLGAVGATLGALFFDLPSTTTQVLIEILLAMSAGASWGLLAAILKTRGGVNEIFGGVALNFIAALVVALLISGAWAPASGGTGSRTAAFDPRTLLPAQQIERTFLSLEMVGAATLALLAVSALLSFTRFGLQLRATGKSPTSARALGIPIERNIWLAMTGCGALAGLGGASLVLHPPIGQLASNSTGGIGFLALLVVLLSGSRPALIAPIAFTFAFMNIGAQRIETALQIDASLIEVLQGILVLSVLLFDGVRLRLQAAQDDRLAAALTAQIAAEAEQAVLSSPEAAAHG